MQDCLRRAAGERANHREPVSAVAAPPIVAPPVVVFARRKPQATPGGAAGCSRAGRPVGGGGGRLQRGPPARYDRLAVAGAWAAGGRDEPAGATSAWPETRVRGRNRSGAFATLAQSAGAAWETPRSEGDRLAAGLLKLTAGTAELHFDKGSIARLTGPAVLELRSGDEVFLKRGSLTARVPPQAVGFLVATPLSRIVDLGTEFDVTVEDSGATQTLVRQGRVSLRPQRGEEDLGTPIELAVGGLDRATVSVPDIVGPVLPVSTVARGGQGRFLGRLSAGGKTAEFHSRPAFQEFRTLALKQLRETPDQFGQKWPALAAAGHKRYHGPAQEPDRGTVPFRRGKQFRRKPWDRCARCRRG